MNFKNNRYIFKVNSDQDKCNLRDKKFKTHIESYLNQVIIALFYKKTSKKRLKINYYKCLRMQINFIKIKHFINYIFFYFFLVLPNLGPP
jgi:hypothetical protein